MGLWGLFFGNSSGLPRVSTHSHWSPVYIYKMASSSVLSGVPRETGLLSSMRALCSTISGSNQQCLWSLILLWQDTSLASWKCGFPLISYPSTSLAKVLAATVAVSWGISSLFYLCPTSQVSNLLWISSIDSQRSPPLFFVSPRLTENLPTCFLGFMPQSSLEVDLLFPLSWFSAWGIFYLMNT